MSSQQDFPVSTEQRPSDEGVSIPLPSTQRAPVVEPRHRGLGWWSVPLLLVLAFLVVSFSARNSDLWFHLAAGRQLLEGKTAPGADPFAYTTSNHYWANHAWLFDIGIYWLYGLVG